MISINIPEKSFKHLVLLLFFFPPLGDGEGGVIQAQITLQPNPNAYSKKY